MKTEFIVTLIGVVAIGVITGKFLPIYDWHSGIFSFTNALIVIAVSMVFAATVSVVSYVIRR